MNRRIRLKVLGISYSQIQTGAYALILAEVNGPIRIPVVIGSKEAQSIAIRMERIITPRPLTHDLFASFAHAFGVRLQEVFIYKFEDGIFSSEMTFTNGERQVVLDSRTSDAIAIAMRTNAPIYTTPEILQETGFVMDIQTADENGTSDTGQESAEPDPNDFTIEELERTLSALIENEQYEQAAKVSKILQQKKSAGN